MEKITCIFTRYILQYNKLRTEVQVMHINSIVKKTIRKEGKIGCGECQSSCQSACKTSCTVGNQSCKNNGEKVNVIRKPLI